MSEFKLQVSRRQRATPYTPRVEALGVSGYSIVNHTILPKGFQRSVEEDYWHLKKHVQLWDVGCQRQVELHGPDAARLAQLMTPRNLRNAQVGQCLYAPMVDENGGMLNDPIILKLAEDQYWFSIADADMLLWAKGLATGMALDVRVEEPDVWPLAVQGPRSDDLVARVFGEQVRSIRFFRFERCPFQGHELVVARSGFSKQGGFEIYVDDFALGTYVWDALWQAGEGLELAPGCPNLIERIEAGLLSYGNEMTRDNNPFECGLQRYCQLDGSLEYIGKSALLEIAGKGHAREIRGLLFDGDACPAPQYPWPVTSDNKQVGYVTSAHWSPRFNQNVALAMLDQGYWDANTLISIRSGDGQQRNGIVIALPMEDQ
ncbi:MAG: dimethylsulfoniopropionate demethylase [Gammaproteobacteria bacterium]|nr:dimethylsulfoniopropionate demethylase [Gammaproteobacteria bacterium]